MSSYSRGPRPRTQTQLSNQRDARARLIYAKTLGKPQVIAGQILAQTLRATYRDIELFGAKIAQRRGQRSVRLSTPKLLRGNCEIQVLGILHELSCDANEGTFRVHESASA
jgi:hypothetical protein